MTRGPASFVFGDTAPLAGNRFMRFTVTPTKITLVEKEFIRQEHGEVAAQTRIQQAVAVRENHHGQQYLKVLDKNTETGETTDQSMNRELSYAVLSLMLKHVSVFSLFSEDFDRSRFMGMSVSRAITELMFPSARDCRFLDRNDWHTVLSALDAIGHPVLRLLRESPTFDEFLLALCGDTVQTEEDLAYLVPNFVKLLHLAALPLGRSLTSLKEEYETRHLLHFKSAFSIYDHTLIRFIFENSSAEEKAEVFHDLMALTSMHYAARIGWAGEAENFLDDEDSVFPFHANKELDFTQIPRSSWGELAEVLRSQLRILCIKFNADMKKGSDRKDYRARLRNPVIGTHLSDDVQRWYAERVFDSRMMSAHSVEDVKDSFFELFHVEPWGQDHSRIKYVETDAGAKFLKMPNRNTVRYNPHKWHSSNNVRASDVLLLLMLASPRKTLPQGPERGLRFNAYLKNGQVKLVTQEVFSLEETLAFIEAGTAALDAELAKLGRQATPENRAAFLRCEPAERKSKATWRLYDWGVKDFERLRVLKKCGVRKEEDVQMYNALPDELFYELLSTMTGTDGSQYEAKTFRKITK